MMRTPLLFIAVLGAGVAAAQAPEDEPIVVDSSDLVLDSGTWVDPDANTTVAMPTTESGIPYEQWKHVADDTILIDQRRFDEAGIAAYKTDPELDYDRQLTQDESWWDRFLRWLGRWLEKLFGNRAGRAISHNLDTILLVAGIIIVVWAFRRKLLGSVFGKAAKKAGQVTVIEENIEELDLDALLRDAEKAANWRLALRYQWLKVLRRLVDERRIKWQPRYTDADYLAQLKDPALRAGFSELSFLFKWVWYGDAPMDATRYQRLRPAFEAMQQRSGATPTNAATGAPAQRA